MSCALPASIYPNHNQRPTTPTELPKQVTVNGAKAFEADKDLVFPAATVHMSAAVVKLGDRTMVRLSAHWLCDGRAGG